MQFLSRCSWNKLRFHRDFSVVCQPQASLYVYFVNKLKAVRLLKSEIATQSHRVSGVASQTAAINCSKIALKSQVVYTRDFEVGT